MLRYDGSSRRPPEYLTRREQWRILRLVIALGLVVVLMGQLRGPRAAKVLGIFFGNEEQADRRGDPDNPAGQNTGTQDVGPAQDQLRLRAAGPLEMGRIMAPQEEDSREVQDVGSPHVAQLANVKDNTAFREEDAQPWYELLGILHDADPQALKSHSLGELTPLQLLEQPGAYRGRLVSISGAARQSLHFDPLGADLVGDHAARVGLFAEMTFPDVAARTYMTQTLLADFHRVTIQQSGASVPVIVYALDVPDDFPEGGSLDERVHVTGYFFKNWLYSTDDGLGVGPVVLAKQLQWDQRTPVAVVPEANPRDLTVTICGAAVLAVVATAWLWRRSQAADALRPNFPAKRPAATPDFSQIHIAPSPADESMGGPT